MRWAPILGFNRPYEVSDTGLVRNGDRQLTIRRTTRANYRRVGLMRGKLQIAQLVHRLVAGAFIPNPENKPHVNHKDGDTTNNRVENLEWCTPTENAAHASAMGLLAHGEAHPHAKLTDQQFKEIQALCSDGIKPLAEIGRLFGISGSHVSVIRRGCRNGTDRDRTLAKYTAKTRQPKVLHTAETYAAVRALLREGVLGRRQIAARTGVSVGFVDRIVQGFVCRVERGGAVASPVSTTAPSVFSPQTAGVQPAESAA